VLLTKANLPKDEIESLSERIYERRLPEMFEPHIKYDIQETRRIARLEGIGIGERRGEKRGEQKIKQEIARKLKEQGVATETILAVTGEQPDETKTNESLKEK